MQHQIGRVVIQVITKKNLNHKNNDFDLEPSTPTKSIEKPFQDVEVETKPAIELIHQPPIVPKIVSLQIIPRRNSNTRISEKPANKQKRHDQCDE